MIPQKWKPLKYLNTTETLYEHKMSLCFINKFAIDSIHQIISMVRRLSILFVFVLFGFHPTSTSHYSTSHFSLFKFRPLLSYFTVFENRDKRKQTL